VEIEHLALKLMYCVGRARIQGTATWSVPRLAAEFGLPGIAVTRVACALEAGGLLTLSADDTCTLAREPDAISVQEILMLARNQRSGDFIARDTRVPAVDALSARLDGAWRAACADETLAAMVEDTKTLPVLVAGDGHVLDENGPRV